MRIAALLLGLTLFAGLAAYYLVDEPGAAATDAAIADDDPRRELERLTAQVEALQRGQQELLDAVQSLRAAGARDASPVRQPQLDLDDAVDRWIRTHRPDLLEVAVADDAEAEEDSARARAAALLAGFDQPGLSDAEAQKIWQQIRDAGLMDEVLAILEGAAINDPTNPEAHLALAGGYLNKVMDSQNTMEMGVWAMRADKVLDRALELEPGHWDARFTKAVSLTFYPALLGKQGEAVKHFEMLVEQQKGTAPQPKHAQTYLYLGNLHQQMGNHDQALAAWNQGMDLFPGDTELQAQIDNAVDH